MAHILRRWRSPGSTGSSTGTADAIVDLARKAGWQLRARRDDAIQPVYILDLE